VPPIDLAPLLGLLDRANQTLGRLDGLAPILPDTPLFLYMYVRKEAVLSSQIEGTQSSLSDLLLFEAEETPGVPLDDVREVSNYVAAMDHGLARLKEGFPLSLRLLREIHAILLARGRGETRDPGELKTGSAAHDRETLSSCPHRLRKWLGAWVNSRYSFRLPHLIMRYHCS
jgi:Fic family protein